MGGSRAVTAPASRKDAAWETAALADAVVLALVVRLLGAARLPFQPDEPNSILGAVMITQHGFPVLPSGVLYLHGATVSYLMAPVLALGLADIDHLFPLRLISVIAGTSAVCLTWLLAKRVFGRPWIAFGSALLLAIDPLSVLWSDHARMYAVEQCFSILTVLLFVGVIGPVAAPRARLAGMAISFWLAVYAHLGASFLWPAMTICALVLFGRDLFGKRRDLTLALGVCLLAPLSLALLSTLSGRGAGTREAAETDFLPGLSVLGDHNLDLGRLVHPSLTGWVETFGVSPFGAIIPILLAILSGLLVSRWLQAAARSDSRSESHRIGVLVTLYWVPIALFAFVTGDPEPRYLVFLQPLACILLVGGLAEAWGYRSAIVGRGGAIAGAAAGILGVLLVANNAWALARFDSWGPDGTGDYRPALTLVAAERQPNDLVLVGSPQMGYLKLEDIPALRFLTGEEGAVRGERYVRPDSATGVPVDYWIGMEAIDSVAGLCQTLTDHPGSWIVLEAGANKRGLSRGPVTDVIAGSGDAVYQEQGMVVFHSRQPNTWDNPATKACRGAGLR